eukprot:4558813-Pyramimonas_sp.AAC.1
MSIVEPIPIPTSMAWAPLANVPPLDAEIGRSLRESGGPLSPTGSGLVGLRCHGLAWMRIGLPTSRRRCVEAG